MLKNAVLEIHEVFSLSSTVYWPVLLHCYYLQLYCYSFMLYPIVMCFMAADLSVAAVVICISAVYCLLQPTLFFNLFFMFTRVLFKLLFIRFEKKVCLAVASSTWKAWFSLFTLCLILTGTVVWTYICTKCCQTTDRQKQVFTFVMWLWLHLQMSSPFNLGNKERNV